MIRSFTGHNFYDSIRSPGGGLDFCVMIENDFFGLPEFVVNEIVTESAGGENVRIYNYVRRGHVLVPQFMCLMNATEMLVAGRAVAGAAQAVFNGEIQELTKAARH